MQKNYTAAFEQYVKKQCKQTPLAIWQDETGLYAKLPKTPGSGNFSQTFSESNTVRLGFRDLDNRYIVGDEGVELFSGVE